MKIKDIKARWILDSRGNPTVEADVILDNGKIGRASVPSGASTGAHEAIELRDNSEEFGGLGVQKAIKNIHQLIRPVLIGLNPNDQSAIDRTMIMLDATQNKSKLGANAILAVSLAVAKAAASAQHVQLYQHINQLIGSPQMSLPRPMINILNGGKHAFDGTDIQETMIVPVNSSSIAEALHCGSRIFHHLADIIKANKQSTLVGDEGGFAPSLKNYEAILDLLMQSISSAGFEPGKDVAIALDLLLVELLDRFLESFLSNPASHLALNHLL
jgi:enolase